MPRNSHIQQLTRAFLAIPNDTIISEELNALKPHSRWLYIVLCTKFNRERNRINGEYTFTYDDLQKITGYDRRRIAACVKELKAKDFIDVVPGGKNNPSQYKPNKKWLC